MEIRYVSQAGAILKRGRSSRSGKQLLIGARLHADTADIVDGLIRVRTVPDKHNAFDEGFVETAHLSERQQLKVFYVDVGQGDATFIEAEGAIVVIDGGPNRGFFDRLMRRLESLRRADANLGRPRRETLEINAIVISHFDQDHYFGLIRVLEAPEFVVGTIYHNGLPRYGENANRDLNLGTITQHGDGSRSVSTDLRDLDSARALLASGRLVTAAGNPNHFAKFLTAAVNAADDGRLGSMRVLVRRHVNGEPDLLLDTGDDLQFEVLAPVTTSPTGSIRLPVFPDPHDVTATNPNPAPSESHTINGNSIVLRLRFGSNTFLFGGDLNQPSQRYLAQRYGNLSAFRADVNKACHHGSSDFDVGYLRVVAPNATVFSSGDSGSHDHPLPDAMGAAAKHSRGEFPLVFSTELAREVGSGGIKLGHINARSNGAQIVMAQKLERPTTKKTWHTFPLPFPGPFGH